MSTACPNVSPSRVHLRHIAKPVGMATFDDPVPDTEMPSSPVVDTTNLYQQTHGADRKIPKSLEARRKVVGSPRGDFIEAVGPGIFSDSTDKP